MRVAVTAMIVGMVVVMIVVVIVVVIVVMGGVVSMVIVVVAMGEWLLAEARPFSRGMLTYVAKRGRRTRVGMHMAWSMLRVWNTGR